MFKKTTLDFRKAGVLNQLVLDYIEKKENLKPFYGFYPNKKGFADLLNTQPYSQFDRAALVNILSRQAGLVKNTSEASQKNIQLLADANAFTVTTGHQLCLFTGPLYFIYKIFSTINLAEELKKENPNHNFVPVYWMASEDHDFEEVSSFNVNEKSVKWNSEQSGAVGNFDTSELKALLPALREALGISENSKYLFDLFEKAYLKHKTLAHATRFLVNDLFGRYGLVVVDGDDAAFKQQFKSFFKDDIFANAAFHTVGKSVKALADLGYHSQVSPRAINCFYIEPGLRARIEKSRDVYNLVGTERNFTKQELDKIIEETPEKISPNVVLRPLYQQVILPNIAYIGGPGELAYWLEFKKLFDDARVVFPILMPRNFVTVIDKVTDQKIEKLKFNVSDFYIGEQELIKKFMITSGKLFDLEAERKTAESFYEEVIKRTTAIDSSLDKHIAAELKRVLNKLDSIALKTNRAVKRKSEVELNRIKNIKQVFFPNGVPQERSENFSSLYITYGVALFNELKNAIDPFILDQKILVEK